MLEEAGGSDSFRKLAVTEEVAKKKSEDAPPVVQVEQDEDKHALNSSALLSFEELGLAKPLVETCRTLGFRKPTPVQRIVVPYLVQNRQSHVLALAATGSGKVSTAESSFKCLLLLTFNYY